MEDRGWACSPCSTAQNIAQLLNEFTLQRAPDRGRSPGGGGGHREYCSRPSAGGSTTYAVDEDGVSLHSGMISRSREYAPRARIESVSVERPLLARLLGLAKVRVEVAGSGESYIDIEYVKSAAAEELRRGILGIAECTDVPEPGAGRRRRRGGRPRGRTRPAPARGDRGHRRPESAAELPQRWGHGGRAHRAGAHRETDPFAAAGHRVPAGGPDGHPRRRRGPWRWRSGRTA